MKILKTLLLGVILLPFSKAADALYIFVDKEAILADDITYTPKGYVSAPLVFGGTAEATDPTWDGKIVLADRGPNSFLDKITKVRDSGGLALIVVNNVAGGFSASLGSGSSTTIIGVTVSGTDGATLKNKVGKTVGIGIIPTPRPVAPQIPSPIGHSGDIIGSDGTNYALIKIAPTVVAIQTGSTVSVGQKVVFGVTADGNPAPTFQWQKDGVNIDGATNATLEFASTQETDAAKYTCIATNSAGSSTSQVYQLTVTP